MDVRQKIKEAGVKYWQIAARYGCSDGNFSRKLRQELNPEAKAKIFKIIDDLQKENAADVGNVSRCGGSRYA